MKVVPKCGQFICTSWAKIGRPSAPQNSAHRAERTNNLTFFGAQKRPFFHPRVQISKTTRSIFKWFSPPCVFFKKTRSLKNFFPKFEFENEIIRKNPKGQNVLPRKRMVRFFLKSLYRYYIKLRTKRSVYIFEIRPVTMRFSTLKKTTHPTRAPATQKLVENFEIFFGEYYCYLCA